MYQNEIPVGDSPEDVERRSVIIRDFYRQWKEQNPSQRKYNLSLGEYINIRMISITETSRHAAKRYNSTLAVLQLDAILTNAKKKSVSKTKQGSKNQNQFERMLLMEYDCVGIGIVKMTVGIKRRTYEKVQYCITALEV